MAVFPDFAIVLLSQPRVFLIVGRQSDQGLVPPRVSSRSGAGGCYVLHSAQPQYSNHQVPKRSQQLRRRPRSHLALVLAKTTSLTQCRPVFNSPVPTPYRKQPAASARSTGRLVMA